jgi:hypothetical protein
MTFNISEVAVCWSSASPSARVRASSFFSNFARVRERGQREFSPSLSSNEDR